MKRILSGALIALSIMGLALVSSVNAPVFASNVSPMCFAGSCPDMSKPGALRPSGPYACGVSSPAYTFYYDAKANTCPAGGKLIVTAN